jgi:hypothetical protein
MKGRILLNILFVASAVAIGAAMSFRPWMVYQRQAAEESQLHKQAVNLERQRVELTWQRDQLTDPITKEEMIRRQGWLQKSETRPTPH